jgi:large-conductance mechanosensitive channel
MVAFAVFIVIKNLNALKKSGATGGANNQGMC